MELLSDMAKSDPLGTAAGSGISPFDRFEIGLAAEEKSLMVDRQKELGAGIVGHLPGLFRSAMGRDPRIISADRHDRQVKGARTAKRSKRGGQGGVAAEQYPIPAG